MSESSIIYQTLILGPFSFTRHTEVCNSFLSSAFLEFFSTTSGHSVFHRNIKLPERCLPDKRIYFHTRAQNQANKLPFFFFWGGGCFAVPS